MKSAGQTKVTDVKVGRQILCKEKPSTPATSACAKKLTATVAMAKKGLTSVHQKLWRKYVYTNALLQVQRFCENFKHPVIAGAERVTPKPIDAQIYAKCVSYVLSGTRKIKGPFGKKFNWSDFLINGAKVVKNIPHAINPFKDD